MVHVAKQEMKWADNYYRHYLMTAFGVSTAAALQIRQLEWLVEAFKTYGWKPKYKPGEVDEQVLALRDRVLSMAAQLPNGQERLRGLCKKICHVDNPGWCKNEAQLKRLLAAIGNAWREEREKGHV
jgi:hypothetical protein